VAPGLFHFNRKERKMRELTQSEIIQVTGGRNDLWRNMSDQYRDTTDKFSDPDFWRNWFRELPDLYREAINSATEMFCIATGDC
jgi:hypothetical protein